MENQEQQPKAKRSAAKKSSKYVLSGNRVFVSGHGLIEAKFDGKDKLPLSDEDVAAIKKKLATEFKNDAKLYTKAFKSILVSVEEADLEIEE